MVPRNWPEGLEFVRTELALGRTFATAALSSKDANRIFRNAANARVAYESAHRYVVWLLLTPVVAQDLNHRFKLLRAQLVSLGESV